MYTVQANTKQRYERDDAIPDVCTLNDLMPILAIYNTRGDVPNASDGSDVIVGVGLSTTRHYTPRVWSLDRV